jgi:hypothetical protein
MEEKTLTGYNMICEAFSQLPSLEYIIWICPTSFIVSNYIDELFRSLDVMASIPRDNETILNSARDTFRGMKILYLNRYDYLSKLSVRQARIEDNDELIPIISSTNPEILADGDHYLLADLILKQDTNNRFFVGLDNKNAIQGMLATSLDVNMSLIMKIFDIDAYPDLIIQADAVPPPPPLLICLLGDLRLIEMKTLETFLYNSNVLFINFQFLKDHFNDLYDTLEERKGGRKGIREEGKYDESKHEESKFDSKHDDSSHSPSASSSSSSKSMLFRYCQLLVSTSPNPTSLQGVVIIGFPRSEEESYDYSSTLISDFDMIIELLDDSEDVDDEEEENLQRHLDSIEILRENYFKEDDPYSIANLSKAANHNSNNTNAFYQKSNKASWIKIPLSKETSPVSNNDKLHSILLNGFDERISRLESAKAINKEKPPKANAFAVTALCLNEGYLSRSLDLVKLAFEEQSDLAYCLYMLSNDVIPSMAMKGFSYIKTRPGISFDQSLYIIHRAFFFVEDNLSLSRILNHDLPSSSSNSAASSESKEESKGNDTAAATTSPNYDLYDFLSNIKLQTERNEILSSLSYSLSSNDVEMIENPDDISFKITLSSKIIGCIVFSRRMLSPDDLNWFRLHYHLDDSLNYNRYRLKNQYLINHFIIDPIFSYFTRHILSICMRKLNKSLFYYHLEKENIPSKEILEHFAFIKSRRFPQGSHISCQNRPILKDTKTEEVISLPKEDSPLYIMNKGSVFSRYKKIISKRIVIVGGSIHSLAFLETLSTISYLYLPNIYYIIDILPTSFRMNDIMVGGM